MTDPAPPEPSPADPFLLYTGMPGAKAPRAAARLARARRPIPTRAEDYLADPGLVDAANVAIRLGQPLLLTGEPGTGKTRFADSLAAELRLGRPLSFETKSTSVAADLFYTFDTLARFHDAQTHQARDPRHYVTYRALGWAILRSLPRERAEPLLSPRTKHDGPRRSVVLIDEIDKAPRDLPNDILIEIERLQFRVMELSDETVIANPRHAPIVVLTSNSERALPDAFLRRCVYYNIPFPTPERLQQIAEQRLKRVVSERPGMLADALTLFAEFRKPEAGLRKPPATAELLGWLRVLHAAATAAGLDNPLRGRPEAVRRMLEGTLGALVKTADDQSSARGILDQWTKPATVTPSPPPPAPPAEGMARPIGS